jgi:hypothetical protein
LQLVALNVTALYFSFVAEGGHDEADEQEADAPSQEDNRKQTRTGEEWVRNYIIVLSLIPPPCDVLRWSLSTCTLERMAGSNREVVLTLLLLI